MVAPVVVMSPALPEVIPYRWVLEFVGFDGVRLLELPVAPWLPLTRLHDAVAYELGRNFLTIGLLLGTVQLMDYDESSICDNGLYDHARLTVVFMTTWKLFIYGAENLPAPCEVEVRPSWHVGDVLHHISSPVFDHFSMYDLALAPGQRGGPQLGEWQGEEVVLDVDAIIEDVLFDGARLNLVDRRRAPDPGNPWHDLT